MKRRVICRSASCRQWCHLLRHEWAMVSSTKDALSQDFTYLSDATNNLESFSQLRDHVLQSNVAVSAMCVSNQKVSNATICWQNNRTFHIIRNVCNRQPAPCAKYVVVAVKIRIERKNLTIYRNYLILRQLVEFIRKC